MDKKLIYPVLILLSVTTASALFSPDTCQPGKDMKIDPFLAVEMEEMPDERIPVLIEMKDRQMPFGIKRSRSVAIKSQKTVVTSLKEMQAEKIEQHWIVNVISAKVSPERINDIADRPDVAKVWLDRKIKIDEPVSTPAAADYGDGIVSAPCLWDIGYNGTGVNISILDTGIDGTHPDLDDGKVVAESDFTDDQTADDLYGHGTHCAGIAAGERNTSTGVSGVAPGASLINAKVMNRAGWGHTSWVISGIEWSIEQDADILSMSLGDFQRDGTGRDPLDMAVANAVNAGYVVVIAAGNSGPGECTMGSPAVAYGAIAVAASDNSDAIAGFSSRGPTGDGRVGIDVAAPGVSIKSANTAGDYTTMSGTSMACPHVAGAAALLLQVNSTLTPEDVERALMNAADDIDYDILEQGAGRLNVTASYYALTNGTLVDDSQWFVGRVHQGNYTKTFTVFNNNDTDVTVNITCSTGDAGDWITLNDTSISVPANANAAFNATMNVTAIPGAGAYDGSIMVSGGSSNITIPVSVNVVQWVDSGTIGYIEGDVDEDAYSVFTRGDWVYYTLDIQTGIANLNLSLDWTNSNSDLDIWLFNPDGGLTKKSVTPHDAPEVISVDNPSTGNWTVAINAWELTTPETYNLTINATGVDIGEITEFTANPEDVERYEGLILYVNFTNNGAESVTVNGTIDIYRLSEYERVWEDVLNLSSESVDAGGYVNWTLEWTASPMLGDYEATAKLYYGDKVTEKTVSFNITDTTPPVITGATANPQSIKADGIESASLNVVATDVGSGVASVTVNLSAIGGSPTQAMDNGSGVWQFTTNTTVVGAFYLPVNVTDTAGNSNTSANIFLNVTDATPPSITDINVTSITTHSATITWDTDECSDSLIRYGTEQGNYTETVHDATDLLNHSIELTGLCWNTTYYFVANSTDQDGNSNESEECSFTTPSNTTISINANANETLAVDAINETDTVIDFAASKNVTGSMTVTVTSNASDFMSNPLNRSSGLGASEYAVEKHIRIDVSDSLNDTSNNVTWAEIKIYYTVADLDRNGDGDAVDEEIDIDESNMCIYWYNISGDWIKLTEGLNLSGFGGSIVYGAGVNTTDTNGYAGYSWVNVSGFCVYGLGGSLLPESTNDGNGGSSSSSSGGGGGGGASGEDYANIALRESVEQEVINGRSVAYGFVKSGNDIMFVNFTSKATYGRIITMVETLHNRSTLVNAAPPRIVYRNINLWVGSAGIATEQNIFDATVSFRVNRTWIDRNNIDIRTIRLCRYDRASETWTRLPTTMTGKNETYTYFESTTREFSSFAITGMKGISLAVPARSVTSVATPVATPSPAATPSATSASESILPAPGIMGAVMVIGFVVWLLKRKRD